MAKKLSKEELAKTKLPDFDPPVDPGQTRLFGTQKVGAKKSAVAAAKKTDTKKAAKAAPEKKAAPAGRPRKREETYSTTSFRLPPETLRRLRVRAALDGVSAADVIIRLADEMDVPGIDK